MKLFKAKNIYANNKNKIYFRQSVIFAGKLKFKNSEPIFFDFDFGSLVIFYSLFLFIVTICVAIFLLNSWFAQKAHRGKKGGRNKKKNSKKQN